MVTEHHHLRCIFLWLRLGFLKTLYTVTRLARHKRHQFFCGFVGEGTGLWPHYRLEKARHSAHNTATLPTPQPPPVGLFSSRPKSPTTTPPPTSHTKTLDSERIVCLVAVGSLVPRCFSKSNFFSLLARNCGGRGRRDLASSAFHHARCGSRPPARRGINAKYIGEYFFHVATLTRIVETCDVAWTIMQHCGFVPYLTLVV